MFCRLSGDGDKAREWIAPLSSNASVPENAYVLAALDLGEPSPVWPSVIDRLAHRPRLPSATRGARAPPSSTLWRGLAA